MLRAHTLVVAIASKYSMTSSVTINDLQLREAAASGEEIDIQDLYYRFTLDSIGVIGEERREFE